MLYCLDRWIMSNCSTMLVLEGLSCRVRCLCVCSRRWPTSWPGRRESTGPDIYESPLLCWRWLRLCSVSFSSQVQSTSSPLQWKAKGRSRNSIHAILFFYWYIFIDAYLIQTFRCTVHFCITRHFRTPLQPQEHWKTFFSFWNCAICLSASVSELHFSCRILLQSSFNNSFLCYVASCCTKIALHSLCLCLQPLLLSLTSVLQVGFSFTRRASSYSMLRPFLSGSTACSSCCSMGRLPLSLSTCRGTHSWSCLKELQVTTIRHMRTRQR